MVRLNMRPLATIADLIRFIEQEYPHKAALSDYLGGEWSSLSYEQLLDEVKALSLWLVHAGVQKGENIGILAPSSMRWTIVDLACLSIGAVVVPLFGNISEENFVFQCTQANIRLIFVAGAEQGSMWFKQRSLFSRTVSLDDTFKETLKETKQNYHAIPYETARALGAEELKRHPQLFEELLSKIHPEDLATLIYTSGSTGIPKGVMLTHRALVANTYINPMPWDSAHDRYLSILPLAHIFGRSLNLIMLHWGIPIYYFNDLKNIGQACAQIHPTVIALVPRLLEKLYTKMVAGVEHAGFLKRTIGHWAFSLADEEEGKFFKTLMHPIADKIVYAHLRDALGGALRIIISGGAPLNPHLTHFFIDIGLPIYEGYGLTEASIVSVNTPLHRKIGTVGPKIESLEVRLGPDNELLVKGPIVFSGFYKNPKATQQTLDPNGWLHTGDKATIDEEGFITINGRLKELVKSSVGEYIAPVPIEQQLSKAPFIDLSMIIAERRKYVTALIFPNFEVLHRLKEAQQQNHLSDEEFLNSSYIQHEMIRLLDHLNKHLNHWEQVRDFRFILTPPSVEGGELTPSMKLRRDAVSRRYKEVIDSMYDEAIVE